MYAFSIKNQYMHDLSVDGFAERSVRGSETEWMRMMRMQRRGKAGLGGRSGSFHVHRRSTVAVLCASFCMHQPALLKSGVLRCQVVQVFSSGSGVDLNIDCHRGGERVWAATQHP